MIKEHFVARRPAGRPVHHLHVSDRRPHIFDTLSRISLLLVWVFGIGASVFRESFYWHHYTPWQQKQSRLTSLSLLN
jgi:hypothetical protein